MGKWVLYLNMQSKTTEYITLHEVLAKWTPR